MYDILIRGGTVLDGSGKPGFRADIGVRNGQIVQVGALSGETARLVLDADGLIAAPGFIDAHSHSDTSFLIDSSGASKLYQGITTEITGNCGDSPFPYPDESGDIRQSASFADFLKRFASDGFAMAVNQAPLVGHGVLRRNVIGAEDRRACPEDIARMQALLKRELDCGAWGLSLGLEYAPGCFADQNELNALGQTVREYDGLVSCHMRSEGLRIRAALEEFINVGRASGVRINISHLKLDNYTVHGHAADVWSIIQGACREGVRVSADVYPYTASCTTLSIRCPRWSLDGGKEALMKHLQGVRRQEVVEGIRFHYFSAERAETCLFVGDGGYWPQIVGKSLRFVAEDLLGTCDYADAAAQVLLRTNALAQCIFFVMSEEDMLYFLRQDTGIGSDGYALPGDEKKLSMKPHPRSYGAVAKFFALVRERGICSLEEAVRRVTSKPAGLLGMSGRGLIQEGFAADITVFDPVSVGSKATYLRPVQLAQGIKHVVVNGEAALMNGQQTDARNGRFLRKLQQGKT